MRYAVLSLALDSRPNSYEFLGFIYEDPESHFHIDGVCWPSWPVELHLLTLVYVQEVGDPSGEEDVSQVLLAHLPLISKTPNRLLVICLQVRVLGINASMSAKELVSP